MTSFLAIGDIHIKLDNLLEIKHLTDTLVTLIHQHQPDYIVLLGDILHTHERIHTNCLNQAAELFRACSSIRPTYVLVGNHDYISNSQFLTDEHWMNPFKAWSNLFIVDRVTQVGSAVLCPYVPDGRLVEALSKPPDALSKPFAWREASVVFAHQTLDGVKMGPVVMDGVEKWLPEYPMLCSGHIHDRQTPQENLYYTGTPIPHAFGESNRKSICMIHTSDPKKVLEIPMDVCSRQILYLSVTEAYAFTHQPRPHHHLRITVRGQPEETKAYRKSDAYKRLIAVGVKVVFDEPKEERPEEKKEVKSVEEILWSMVKGDLSLAHHYRTFIKSDVEIEMER
jgi:DNA repair exonuclease SbcCD nuclease subunit